MNDFAANVFLISISVFYGVLSVIAVIAFIKYVKEKDDKDDTRIKKMIESRDEYFSEANASTTEKGEKIDVTNIN